MIEKIVEENGKILVYEKKDNEIKKYTFSKDDKRLIKYIELYIKSKKSYLNKYKESLKRKYEKDVKKFNKIVIIIAQVLAIPAIFVSLLTPNFLLATFLYFSFFGIEIGSAVLVQGNDGTFNANDMERLKIEDIEALIEKMDLLKDDVKYLSIEKEKELEKQKEIERIKALPKGVRVNDNQNQFYQSNSNRIAPHEMAIIDEIAKVEYYMSGDDIYICRRRILEEFNNLRKSNPDKRRTTILREMLEERQELRRKR